MTNKTIEERFWEKVDRTGGEASCWVWRAGLGRRGYGKFHLRGRTRPAHRVSYEMSVGPVSPDTVVRHKCDNPPCVNPGHLLLGTQSDNIVDKVKRHRDARQLLSEASVVSARWLSALELFSVSDLARRFGVSNSAMQHAVSGRHFKHLAHPPA